MKKLGTLIIAVALTLTMIPTMVFADKAAEPSLLRTSIYDDQGQVYKDEPPITGTFEDALYMDGLSMSVALYVQTVSSQETISRKIISDVTKLKVVDKNAKEVGTVVACEENRKFVTINLKKMYNCYLQYDYEGKTLRMPITADLPGIYCATNYKSPRSTYIETLKCSSGKTNSFYLIVPNKNASKLRASYYTGNKKVTVGITKKNSCFTAKKINYKGKTVYKITLKRPFVTEYLDFNDRNFYSGVSFDYNLYAKIKVSGKGKVFDESQIYHGNTATSSTKITALLNYEGKNLETVNRYFVIVDPAEGYKLSGFYYGSKKLTVGGIFSDKYYKIVDAQGNLVNPRGEEAATQAWEDENGFGIDVEKDIFEKNNWNTTSINFNENGYAHIPLEQYLAATGLVNGGILSDGGSYLIFNDKTVKIDGKTVGNKVTTLTGKTITAKFVKIK